MSGKINAKPVKVIDISQQMKALHKRLLFSDRVEDHCWEVFGWPHELAMNMCKPLPWIVAEHKIFDKLFPALECFGEDEDQC